MTTAQSPVDVLVGALVALKNEAHGAWMDGFRLAAKPVEEACITALAKYRAEAAALAAEVPALPRCACAKCFEGKCMLIPDKGETLCEHCIEYGHDSKLAAEVPAVPWGCPSCGWVGLRLAAPPPAPVPGGMLHEARLALERLAVKTHPLISNADGWVRTADVLATIARLAAATPPEVVVGMGEGMVTPGVPAAPPVSEAERGELAMRLQRMRSYLDSAEANIQEAQREREVTADMLAVPLAARPSPSTPHVQQQGEACVCPFPRDKCPCCEHACLVCVMAVEDQCDPDRIAARIPEAPTPPLEKCGTCYGTREVGRAIKDANGRQVGNERRPCPDCNGDAK